MQLSYMSKREVERDEANDPLLHTVRLMRESGAMTPEAALALYSEVGDAVERRVEAAAARPRLESAGDVMASLLPPKREVVRMQRPSSG